VLITTEGEIKAKVINIVRKEDLFSLLQSCSTGKFSASSWTRQVSRYKKRSALYWILKSKTHRFHVTHNQNIWTLLVW